MTIEVEAKSMSFVNILNRLSRSVAIMAPFFKNTVREKCQVRVPSAADFIFRQLPCFKGLVSENAKKTRKKAIVEYLDYQIPVTQLNGDMQAAKRD